MSYSLRLSYPAECLQKFTIPASRSALRDPTEVERPTPFEGGKPVASTAIEDVDTGLLEVSRHCHQLDGTISLTLTSIRMKSVLGWGYSATWPLTANWNG